jgi:hypothetical protein
MDTGEVPGYLSRFKLGTVRKIESYGNVNEAGVMSISYRSKFVEAVKMFRGRRIKITVEPLYKTRSTQVIQEDGTVTRGQNGYYFSVVVNEYRNGAWEMQQRLLTSAQAHEELKANCNYVEVYNETTGEVMRTVRSTADMTTVEFEEYLSRCRAFVLDWFGIDIPLPNVQTEMELKIN